MDWQDVARRRAFSIWLRTGRVPQWARPAPPEVKYNPWHDPDDGRFTFAGTGRYFAPGGSGSGGAAHSTNARMSERPKEPKKEAYGGYGGGGRGFTSGGAEGSWEPDEKPQRSDEPRPSTPPSIRNSPRPRPAPSRYTRRGSDDPRTWQRKHANGYEWRLDETGLFRELEGVVTLNDTPRRSRRAQSRAGGQDRRRTDDGGHYIPPRLNGPVEEFNHFAQDMNLNRGRYRVLEDQWYRESRAGKRVEVKIQAVYPENSRRPSYLNVWFKIDGELQSQQFPNEPLETSRGNR